jgi:hypothetical protein
MYPSQKDTLVIVAPVSSTCVSDPKVVPSWTQAASSHARHAVQRVATVSQRQLMSQKHDCGCKSAAVTLAAAPFVSDAAVIVVASSVWSQRQNVFVLDASHVAGHWACSSCPAEPAHSVEHPAPELALVHVDVKVSELPPVASTYSPDFVFK